VVYPEELRVSTLSCALTPSPGWFVVERERARESERESERERARERERLERERAGRERGREEGRGGPSSPAP